MTRVCLLPLHVQYLFTSFVTALFFFTFFKEQLLHTVIIPVLHYFIFDMMIYYLHDNFFSVLQV